MANKQLHRRIWAALESEMDAIAERDPKKANWRKELDEISVENQRKRRERGEHFDDWEVFEALLLAMLSANNDWSKVQRIRPQLRSAALDFDSQAFIKLSNTDSVHERLKPLKVDSISLRQRLGDLQNTIAKLASHSHTPQAMDRYIADQFEQVGRIPEQLALVFGLTGSSKANERKWDGFQVPTAAEALRNLGYDLAKPDRHILRAVGSWGLVEFPGWDGDRTRFPSANPTKLLEAMRAIRAFAGDIGESVSLTDTTIWYACSKGGGNLTNRHLRQLAA